MIEILLTGTLSLNSIKLVSAPKTYILKLMDKNDNNFTLKIFCYRDPCISLSIILVYNFIGTKKNRLNETVF